jgi:hypothetical protein
MTQIDGYEAARQAVLKNTSLRQARLENLERWVEGTQYDDRPSWWSDDKPLWERAPCIVYPVARIAIQSNTDLVLGEGRFPVFSSKPGEGEADEENGLNEVDSVTLDRFIVEHHRLCCFRAHCRYAFASAQACGSVLAVHGVRNGRPRADLIPAKWANPKLDALGAVTSVEIRYPYIEEFRRQNGTWAARAMLYRRVIDATRDVTYLPAEARETGAEPSWVEDTALTVTHGLGFCPAVWYPFMRGCVPVNQVDGNAVHAGLLDEIQAHDIALSQRHRGALLSEPQICEIGVVPGYSPTEIGSKPLVPATAKGGKIGPDNPELTGAGYGSPSPGKARKKGPGYPWQYSDPSTKVELLCYPGEALKAQDDNARDLRMKLQEALCVVFLDPESIKFASTTSGKALEAIKQKQLDRCDQYRDDLRDNFLLPSVDMQLRIAHKLGKGLRVPGVSKVLSLLQKFDDGMDKPQSAA